MLSLDIQINMMKMLLSLQLTPVIRQGKKNEKAGDNSYDEPAKKVSENLETSATRKQDKQPKSRKIKINCPSSSPEIVTRSSKKK